MTRILEFSDIEKSYAKDARILDGVTFAVDQGEVVGLLGRNGAGKTTLIHIAMGLLFSDAGSVRVFGLSPSRDAVAVKRRIGYVAENQILPSALVGELVDFHRRLFPSWDNEMASSLLDRFGLPANAKIHRLSKGQARQVALLCAVCHRPELLILDEPASGLDPAIRREFLEISIQLLNREGTTVLFSSHYLNDVERLGGRIVLLDQGKVRIDSELDRLQQDFCLALLRSADVSDSSLVMRIPGCMRTRRIGSEWHAVFRGAPEEVHQRLQAAFDGCGIRCVPLPLENLFCELLGGRQEELPRKNSELR